MFQSTHKDLADLLRWNFSHSVLPAKCWRFLYDESVYETYVSFRQRASSARWVFARDLHRPYCVHDLRGTTFSNLERYLKLLFIMDTDDKCRSDNCLDLKASTNSPKSYSDFLDLIGRTRNIDRSNLLFDSDYLNSMQFSKMDRDNNTYLGSAKSLDDGANHVETHRSCQYIVPRPAFDLPCFKVTRSQEIQHEAQPEPESRGDTMSIFNGISSQQWTVIDRSSYANPLSGWQTNETGESPLGEMQQHKNELHTKANFNDTGYVELEVSPPLSFPRPSTEADQPEDILFRPLKEFKPACATVVEALRCGLYLISYTDIHEDGSISLKDNNGETVDISTLRASTRPITYNEVYIGQRVCIRGGRGLVLCEVKKKIEPTKCRHQDIYTLSILNRTNDNQLITGTLTMTRRQVYQVPASVLVQRLYDDGRPLTPGTMVRFFTSEVSPSNVYWQEREIELLTLLAIIESKSKVDLDEPEIRKAFIFFLGNLPTPGHLLVDKSFTAFSL